MNEGTLYLCATPIGNLSDLSPRVKDTLNEVDLIAAEDTRNSIKLLNHFDIHTPMTSYHEYNKYDKANDLIRQMRDGRNVALITDAGTPAISDPGEVLVRMCREAGITVTSLPGPCACITALTLSGMCTRRFSFEGFLPPDKKERNEILKQLSTELRTMVIYEAPHHLRGLLSQLYETLGDREVAICKELTKKHENCMNTTLGAAIAYYEQNEPKGEYVLVIAGRNPEEVKKEQADKWLFMRLEDHMDYYEQQGFDRKEAMKKVAADRGISKRDVYQQLL